MKQLSDKKVRGSFFLRTAEAFFIVLTFVPFLAGCKDGRTGSVGMQEEQEKKQQDETKEPGEKAEEEQDSYTYVEKLEIEDYNNKEARYQIYMPKGSEVNDGFGFYHQHGIYFTATVNNIGDYESFSDYYDMTLEYWPGPDTDYTDIYASGVVENGEDRYFILTGRGTDYDGTPQEIRRIEYMVAEPGGDYVNWNIAINQAGVDEETSLALAELEECYGISLERLKQESPIQKIVLDEDEYTAGEGDKELESLEGYRYLGVASLADYYGEGVCPVMMPRGYHTNVEDSHAYAFLHGVWVTVDVGEFYDGSVLMTDLKSILDMKYEARDRNTEQMRNVWRSAMESVPGFENAMYAVVSYEKKGCDTEDYYPKAEVVCFIQYDEEHYLDLEIFLSGEKYDEDTNTVIRELETAYGLDLSKYYKEGEEPNMQKTGNGDTITLAKLTGGGGSDMPESEEALPDTILWFNATYAPLTYSNGWDWKLVGGMKPTAENIEIDKYVLRQSWGIHDRETAIEKVEQLKEEGHRATCRECMKELEEAGLMDLDERKFRSALLKSEFADEPYRYLIAYQMYQAGLDADDMAAWDLCRVNQLYAAFYLCGYMTYEEAMDASLENSLILQKMYSSWDEMMDGYLLGYQFWRKDPDTSADSPTKERRRMYEMMLQSEENPYQLDWNTELEKSW